MAFGGGKGTWNAAGGQNSADSLILDAAPREYVQD
jgi:hypothetical protein